MTTSGPSPSPTREIGLARVLTFLLVATIFVSIAIPKAGFKIGEIPITAGTLLFGTTLLLGIIAFASGRALPQSAVVSALLATSAYFAVRLTATALTGDVAIDAIVAFALSPLLAVAVIAIIRSTESLNRFLAAICVGFWIVVTFGLVQHFIGIDVMTIPGITVNYSDYVEGPGWYLDKNNAVGSNVKLFSTYQNGNLLGVNLLLFFPIVFERTRSTLKPLALVLFLAVEFLTLSRSVWLGVAVYILLRFLLRKAKSPPDLLVRMSVTMALLVAIPVAFVMSPQLADRLGQASPDDLWQAAGRTPALLDLLGSTSSNPAALVFGPVGVTQFDGDAFEITLGAVYKYAGILGILSITIAVAVAFWSARVPKDSLSRAVRIAMCCYLITALVEGAFLLPPTSVIFWAIIGLGVANRRIHHAAINRDTPWDEGHSIKPVASRETLSAYHTTSRPASTKPGYGHRDL